MTLRLFNEIETSKIGQRGLLGILKKDIQKYTPGTLVEVAGTVEKNAVDAVIDYLDAADILGRMATPTVQPQTKRKGTSQNKNPQSEIGRIREALDQD